MANKDQYTAEQFIKAIKGSGGIVTSIARRVGCDWYTAKKYIDNYATVKRAYNAECEGILDLAETKLIENVNNGDMRAIKYLLSTKGKKRGYIERQEVEQVGEVNIRVTYDDNIRPNSQAKTPAPEAG